MTRDETVALFLECEAKRRDARAAALAGGKSKEEARDIAHEAAKAHWNAWAGPLLAERKAMEADGRWAAKIEEGILEPENEETRTWMEAAKASFSYGRFLVREAEGDKEAAGKEKENERGELPVQSIHLEEDGADFSGFIFPDYVRFDSATFSGHAQFGSATFSGDAQFGNAIFSRDAGFDSATFSGITWFNGATFSGDTRFDSATFSGDTWFDSATFSGYTRFDEAIFSDHAGFDAATFSGDAGFNCATFNGYARFKSATFSGDARFDGTTFSDHTLFSNATFSGRTWFDSAIFCDYARFDSAIFSGYASFHGVFFQNYTSYNEAKFLREAGFTGIKVDRSFQMTGAMFKQVPAFNQADFKQAPDLDNVKFPLPLFWQKGDAELIARYRALRRMAIQGADYEREQMAFKGELRSRRWTMDKWWSIGTWLGLFYDGVADCGCSMLQPILIWLTSVPVFAALYLRAADQAQGFSCGVPFIKALYLSGRNALVLFGGGRDARIAQAYRCLYGGDGEPHIPDSVSFLEAFVQVPLSAVLIFLLLLAIKNRFKIK